MWQGFISFWLIAIAMRPNAQLSVIRSSVRLLAEHPQAGRPMDQMPDGYRKWPIAFGSAGYLALHHFSGEDVVILAIRHVREQRY
ncbi:type II toxin-antitoxin system RelE/ParE family toxin [Rhizobium sp. FY34]|uniref:type II toxin-antitoxin system RelE/ParE family toxin n=1 Tax=Rhizobium sp. FY34 TaxID=2562309 RepID=UPI00197E0B90|nr:type II toxin-antitoxin system RelE/ParE family toxin [Rhizobium sp. FY34]